MTRQIPPTCRGCGRAFSGHAPSVWEHARTYDPAGHTYLCRPCRPRPKPRIAMTCRGCGVVHQLKPGEVRSRSRLATATTGDAARWDVDIAAGVGTYVCVDCSTARNITAYQARLRKRMGRAGAAKRMFAPIARWRTEQPDAYRESRARARTEGLRTPLTPRQRAVRGLGLLEIDLRGHFSLCQFCDQLIYTKARDRARYPAAGQYHAACVTAWRRSQKRMLTVMPSSPGRPGRGRSDTDLRQAYRRTVLFFRQQEGSRGALRDRDGQLQSIADLAASLGVSRKTLYDSVERFRQLLLAAQAATGSVRRWRDVFLTLSDETDATHEPHAGCTRPGEKNHTGCTPFRVAKSSPVWHSGKTPQPAAESRPGQRETPPS